MLTRSMMDEMDAWDLISVGPREAIQNLPRYSERKSRSNRMAVGIAQRIITEGISDQIAVNIMDIQDPKESRPQTNRKDTASQW